MYGSKKFTKDLAKRMEEYAAESRRISAAQSSSYHSYTSSYAKIPKYSAQGPSHFQACKQSPYQSPSPYHTPGACFSGYYTAGHSPQNLSSAHNTPPPHHKYNSPSTSVYSSFTASARPFDYSSLRRPFLHALEHSPHDHRRATKRHAETDAHADMRLGIRANMHGGTRAEMRANAHADTRSEMRAQMHTDTRAELRVDTRPVMRAGEQLRVESRDDLEPSTDVSDASEDDDDDDDEDDDGDSSDDSNETDSSGGSTPQPRIGSPHDDAPSAFRPFQKTNKQKRWLWRPFVPSYASSCPGPIRMSQDRRFCPVLVAPCTATNLWPTNIERVLPLYPCSRGCGRVFRSGDQRDEHVRSLDCPEYKPFQCRYNCNTTFRTKLDCSSHEKYTCPSDTSFRCSCGQRFLTKIACKNHPLMHRKQLMPVPCPQQCGLLFESETKAQQHEKMTCPRLAVYYCRKGCHMELVTRQARDAHEEACDGSCATPPV